MAVITDQMMLGVIFRDGNPIAVSAVKLDNGAQDVVFEPMTRWEYLMFRLRRFFDWF